MKSGVFAKIASNAEVIYLFNVKGFSSNRFGFNVKMRSVKKLILIFLLSILPLQYAWAAAAAYCQHEQEMSTHFGHHSHEHKAQAGTPDDEEAPAGSKVDLDCEVCQLSTQLSFLSAVTDIVPPSGFELSTHLFPSYSSHIPDGPQKPDWRVVA